MKKLLFSSILLIGFAISTKAQIGIGTTSPDASAELEISATNKGVLIPRLTQTQRDAITTPATSLLIYQTDNTPGFYYYNGSAWQILSQELELPNSPNTGDMVYWNGSDWVTIAAPNYEGAFLQYQSGAPAWVGGNFATGTVFCNGITAVIEVINPTTGKVWMDRNLGATQVATSSTDANSYGDLYQWGRGADGHQCRNSNATTTLSPANQPGHGDFIITTNSSENDWLSTQNTNLWQGVNGVNNPCPVGYRLPTDTELDNEQQTWTSTDVAGAFASPLKWTATGYRRYDNATINSVGTKGYFWSSTVNGTSSRRLGSTEMATTSRGHALAVRCIKN